MPLGASTPLPTLLSAAFATLAVTGCGLTVNVGDDTTRRTEEDTVPVDELEAIDITTENGAVEVRAGDDDEITIRSVFEESDEGDADSSIEVENDRLVVRGECDAGWWQDCSVAFVVTVPSSFRVDVSTDNGRVDVIGLAGDVHVETDNGRIGADDIRSATFGAHTDNGRISLAFEEAPTTVIAETDNGAIDIELPRLAGDDAGYDVDTSTDNGRVDVGVSTDPRSEHRITAASDNGSIDVRHPANRSAP
jgi:DUF4097 and DUF4098 domain-containing protein YvlB